MLTSVDGAGRYSAPREAKSRLTHLSPWSRPQGLEPSAESVSFWRRLGAETL